MIILSQFAAAISTSFCERRVDLCSRRLGDTNTKRNLLVCLLLDFICHLSILNTTSFLLVKNFCDLFGFLFIVLRTSASLLHYFIVNLARHAWATNCALGLWASHTESAGDGIKYL